MYGRQRGVVGQAAEAEEAAGQRSVEVGDVVVVRALDRGQRLVIGDPAVREEPTRDPDDPVDHLGLDAVAVLILASLDGIGRSGLLARSEAGVGQDAAAPSAGHAGTVEAPGAEHRVAGDPHLAPIAPYA